MKVNIHYGSEHVFTFKGLYRVDWEDGRALPDLFHGSGRGLLEYITPHYCPVTIINAELSLRSVHNHTTGCFGRLCKVLVFWQADLDNNPEWLRVMLADGWQEAPADWIQERETLMTSEYCTKEVMLIARDYE